MATYLKPSLYTVRIPLCSCLIHFSPSTKVNITQPSSLLKTLSLFSPNNFSLSLYVKIRLNQRRNFFLQGNHPICLSVPKYFAFLNNTMEKVSKALPLFLVWMLCVLTYWRNFILHLFCLSWFFWFQDQVLIQKHKTI